MKNLVIAGAALAAFAGMPAMAQPTVGAPAAELPSPERAQELLFDAARMGRADLLDGLLNLGADIDAADAKGFTPLILAAYAGEGAMVDALIAAGTDPCKPDTERGNTALMGVAFRGHDAIAQRLIDSGCDVDARNFAGQTALMMAAMFGRDAQIDMLIAGGADATLADARGNTAASVAAMQGNTALAQKLGG